jgi:Protein of unknown function (DUF4232)
MTKLSRCAVATAAAVLAIGAGTASWAATAASAAPVRPAAPSATIPRCAPGQLAVWVSPDSANGAAGTIHYRLDFTNISDAVCHLYSWPGVSATNSYGKQLGVPAIRNPDAPATYVNIWPDGTVHANLGYVDVQVSPGCKPETATFLKVYPPDDFGSRNAFFPLPVCTNNTYDLTIGRVQPGA